MTRTSESERSRQLAIRRARGCVPRAEYEAACKAKRDADRAAIDARKAARKAKGDANRAAKAERAAKPKPRPSKPVFKQSRNLRLVYCTSTKPSVVAPRPMTSEEWIAMGGQIERIANGVVSKPLQFIGFRAFGRVA